MCATLRARRVPAARPGPAAAPCRDSRRRAGSRQRRGLRRRHREVVVLLGAEPAEAVAQVRAAARDRRRVAATAVDHAAGVHHRRAGRHLGVRDRVVRRRRLHHLLGRAQRAVGPAVAARHETRGAVVAREVDERDDRCELQLDAACARHVAPHRLVAVQPLVLRAGTALQQVSDVELVARARRQQHAVGEREQERRAHHVGREGRRQAGHPRDLPRLRAVKGLEHGVEHRRRRVGRGDRRLDLVVDARDDVRVEQALDDRGAVVADRRVHEIRVGVAGEALQRGGHDSTTTPGARPESSGRACGAVSGAAGSSRRALRADRRPAPRSRRA